MQKQLLGWCVLWLGLVAAAGAQNSNSGGRLVRWENFPSVHVAPRHIDIWLPACTQKPCAVIYLHDGQMLFDSTQTWNRKAWHIQDAVAKLIAEKKIDPVILVGIWNTPDRIMEYFPTQWEVDTALVQHLSRRMANGKLPLGDAYLQFLVAELKPAIDSAFHTLPDAAHTAVMGSSMGGLISLYAHLSYPHVFGRAACMSTAWLTFLEPGYAVTLAAGNHLHRSLGAAGERKIYMDYGTGESDAAYERAQQWIDWIFRASGYDSLHYQTKVFPGHVHDEAAWGERVHHPLLFLLGNETLRE